MSFDLDFIMSTTLIKVDLPNETLRICDGGFIKDGADTYLSEHPEFGTLSSGEGITEGEGDEAPQASIVFQAKDNTALNVVANPDMQWSPVSLYQASVDEMTGNVISKIPLFFGFVDVPTFNSGSSGRFVELSLVSDTERFFLTNDGNRLSHENHIESYAGELGLNNMTSVERDVAWGTESRPRATVSTGSGGGGGGSTPGTSIYFR